MLKSFSRQLKSNWFAWLFPCIAIGISSWLVWDYFRQRGPTIKIYFDDASSIQPEKTKIRFRGVTIGSVDKVAISADQKVAIVYVSLQKENEHFAVEGTKFWMVLPKVNFQGISGLETIFEGTYISVLPGPPENEKKFEFHGQLGGESNDPLEDTTAYILETSQAGSLNIGDNVTFRGLNVGTVTSIRLSKSSQNILLQINLQNKYVHLIRTNTVFWRRVAVQAKLGLFNSEVKVGSLDSLLHGGIEFFTPTEAGSRTKAFTHFSVLPEPPKGFETWNPNLE